MQVQGLANDVLAVKLADSAVGEARVGIGKIGEALRATMTVVK